MFDGGKMKDLDKEFDKKFVKIVRKLSKDGGSEVAVKIVASEGSLPLAQAKEIKAFIAKQRKQLLKEIILPPSGQVCLKKKNN
jgi:hypothetical protein